MLSTVLLLGALAIGADAEPAFTGLRLLRECRSMLKDPAKMEPSEALGAVHCAGYVEGIADAHALFASLSNNASRKWCDPPSGLEAEQRIMIVVKWLEANPESLHRSARGEVLLAHATAFPCK